MSEVDYALPEAVAGDEVNFKTYYQLHRQRPSRLRSFKAGTTDRALAPAHQSDAGATVLRPHDPALKDTPVWRGDRNEFVRGEAVYFAQAKSAIAQINKYPRLYLRALKNQYRDVDVAPEREPSLDPLFKSLEGCAVVGKLAGVLIGYMTKWIVKHL